MDGARAKSRQSSHRKPSAVAAIDFGTTNTGYAYYFRPAQYRPIAANDIEVKKQVPTTVLLSPTKDFVAFGEAAEDQYRNLTVEKKHNEYYYFRHFKMNLHHLPHLSNDITIKDATGKEMQAMTVFKEAIKYVKKELLEKMNGGQTGDISESEVRWVITVPAIWRDSAKQFMKAAAILAGIPAKGLVLALEPESAAICCKDMALNNVAGVEGVMLKAFDPGQMYIVLDCGGGTVDTTVHEVQTDGRLKELHAAAGGPWGGKLVNDAFEKHICDMVGSDIFHKFMKEDTSQWLEFESNFEAKKRRYEGKQDITLTFPAYLISAFKTVRKIELQDHFERDYMRNRMCQLIGNNLVLKPKLMDHLFANATDKINAHIEDLRRKEKLKIISTILLVGGFSESKAVVNAVKEHFKNELRVVTPPYGGSAILKGAVMYGWDQNIIAVRVCPFTYGVHTRCVYNANIHKGSTPKEFNGKRVVDNCFHKHLEIDEPVLVGENTTPSTYTLINRNKLVATWRIYKSTQKNPVFCHEKSCSHIGTLRIEIPPSVKETNIKMNICMTCCGTELKATAFLPDHKGVECVANLDFLDTSSLESDMVSSFTE
ncbi:heat shock 70 kDa protein 12A-like [Dreissena polymorpha]|nr:heat shock 70 kDa protein 12A-like [Dreissena polymorpha]XP_052269398.1 heat shock 70 kDa protein 12A-like [Dreissena polymorpha]XP_052269399.1 heat shock 70 kDa protein 12A-like [Dreissena polymorpha]